MNSSALNSAPPASPQPARPARFLVGWGREEETARLVGGLPPGVEPSEEHMAAARLALSAVQQKEPFPDQAGLIRPLPSGLKATAESVLTSPAAATFVGEGWSLGLADVGRTCVLQQMVYMDHQERLAEVRKEDQLRIAQIALPCEPSMEMIGTRVDPGRQIFAFSSANPNLRVVHASTAPVVGSPGGLTVAFNVGVPPSFVQVIKYKGRYILRDGYHRSVGLLMRGIRWVPAFTKTLHSLEEIGWRPGWFLPEVVMGERPPELRDFLDKRIVVDVRVPTNSRTVIIQALEV